MGQIVLENVKEHGLNKRRNYLKTKELDLITSVRILLGAILLCVTTYTYAVGSEFFSFLVGPMIIVMSMVFIKLLGNVRSEIKS